jgi:hypothetical protein
MAKLDKDTIKVLEKQKKRKDWVASEGYADFKKTLMMKVVEMTSLLRLQALPTANPMQLASDYEARRLVGGLIIQTLNDIEGDANSYDSNWKMLNDSESEQMMTYFPQVDKET